MESSFIPYQAVTQLPSGTIAIFAPHPDDEVFGCAGAIMQHLAQKDVVKVVIVTDGRAAVAHSDSDHLIEYIALREQESCQAAQILGYGQPEFWHLEDRQLATAKDWLLFEVSNYLENHAITSVYIPSPLEIHPDHHTLTLTIIEAVKNIPREIKVFMYEIGIPLSPNLLLDITTRWEQKQIAMACFASQLAVQDYRIHVNALNTYRTYTLPKSVQAAEAYYLIDNKTLQINPLLAFGHNRCTLSTQEHLQQLTTQLQQQQQQLNALYQSHSWRLTAPLRWLRRLL
jgi:LmbE family N-acetylglucosaminyl deacetylase